MDWIRRVVVDIKEPEDKDVLWIDSSDPEIHIIKIYDKGYWKPLIADRIVKQTVSYLNGYYVDGTSGAVDVGAEYSVGTIDITGGKTLWFIGEKMTSNEDNLGYAFYDKLGNTIESYCYPVDENIEETSLIEIECAIPVGAVTFRATICDKIDEDNFYCNVGKTYSESVINGGISAKYNTTAYWNSLVGFKPSAGEVIVYSDYHKIIKDGVEIDVPGVKIGSGNAFVQDLAFLGEYEAGILLEHITDTSIHVTPQEKEFWNNKINVDDTTEVINEILILNRN